MEHVLHRSIMKHLEHHCILSDQQHGFRKGRSCETQLILTVNDLAKGIDDLSQVDAESKCYIASGMTWLPFPPQLTFNHSHQ